MSTSLLADRMVKYGKEHNLEVDVDALPFDRMGDRINHTDVLLLGPQIRHLLKKFQADYSDKIPVIDVIDMQDYALLRVEKIFEKSISKLNK
jgi:PTS system cellobiose-specific IIB component